MEHMLRHRIVWTLVRPIIRLVVFIRFRFTSSARRIRGPLIVVCNHVTDWDPLLLGAAFRSQMYFLASEHIMRLGWVSSLLHWLCAPIPRQKGGSAAGSVKTMLRVLKNGGNVAFFPEGNRTWDGVTREFPDSTGKFVRASGATLVTYRLQGGYLSSPRWAGKSLRRGRMQGEIVGVYTPEELREMTVTQVNAVIARDIHEDAFETAKAHPIPFRGKRLAEHLESLLFLCPKCGGAHGMESRDDRFGCRYCGFETRYDATGFFTGEDVPFSTVWEWNRWQQESLPSLCEQAGDAPIFRDSGMELYRVNTAQSSELLARGEMLLYRDRLELPGDLSIPVQEIIGMGLMGATDLYLTTKKGSCFQLRTGKVRNTVKYLDACACLGSPVGCGV